MEYYKIYFSEYDFYYSEDKPIDEFHYKKFNNREEFLLDFTKEFVTFQELDIEVDFDDEYVDDLVALFMFLTDRKNDYSFNNLSKLDISFFIGGYEIWFHREKNSIEVEEDGGYTLNEVESKIVNELIKLIYDYLK